MSEDGVRDRSPTGTVSVSYTHLDVYKRQVLCWTLFFHGCRICKSVRKGRKARFLILSALVCPFLHVAETPYPTRLCLFSIFIVKTHVSLPHSKTGQLLWSHLSILLIVPHTIWFLCILLSTSVSLSELFSTWSHYQLQSLVVNNALGSNCCLLDLNSHRLSFICWLHLILHHT